MMPEVESRVVMYCGNAYEDDLEPAEPVPDTTPPPSLRVLLVDDDEMVGSALAALFRHQGHSVQLAQTGEAALAAATACPPDIAFVDLCLPGGMDGFQLAAAFQMQDAMRQVVLVALSGLSDDGTREQSREAGFAAHLCKPVTIADLNAVLATALRGVPAGG
jgi:CheY-like chemotaxis protein